VLETATLNDAELAEYCRRKGLYVEQLAAWREVCRAANANAGEQARSQREQSKEDKKCIRQWEKELHRKEKALAEAAALLVLRKKPRRSGGTKRKTDQRPRSPVMHEVDPRDGAGRLPACTGVCRARHLPAHFPAMGAGRRRGDGG